MKNILSVFLLVTLVGCATVTIPNYIQDDNPYKRTFYADFDKVRQTTVQTLEEMGWVLDKESDPSVFEQGRSSQVSGQQTLLFTKIRQTSFFVATRYSRLNVYIQTAEENNATEVEVRFLTVTSFTFKNFKDYKHDKAVERIYKHMDEKLKPSS
jgi:hypothetical protein